MTRFATIKRSRARARCVAANDNSPNSIYVYRSEVENLLRRLHGSENSEPGLRLRLRRVATSIIAIAFVCGIPVCAASFLLPKSDSEAGNLVEHKEERNVLSKWGNDLRQSYRTLAQAAGVSELDVHLLMNHSLPGVNAGYITRDRLLRDHLRQQQQRISELIAHSVFSERDPSIVRWLGSANVDETAGRTETKHRSETMSMAA
jgi:hypothetical protein